MASRVNTRTSASAVAGVVNDPGAAALNVGDQGMTVDPAIAGTAADLASRATIDSAVRAVVDPAPHAVGDPTTGATVNTDSIDRMVGGSVGAHVGTAAVPTPGAGAARPGGNADLVTDPSVYCADASGNPGAQAVVAAVLAVRLGVSIAPTTPTVESAMLTAIGTIQRELADL